MKSEFKSPCIIKDTTNTVLIMNDGFGYHLHGEFQGEISDKEYYIDSDCKNITHEYLANTYGEVVSPEHAEFIIGLAKNAGFSVWALHGAESLVSFTFHDAELCLFETESKQLDLSGLKQITIPLPPKAEPKIYPQENIGEPPKHFDCVCNKCGGKCCTGRCEDFPKIGDEILTASKSKAKVLAKHRGKLWIEYISGGKGFNTINADSIQKPKTPEEELRDHIVHLIDESKRIGVNSYVLALHLMGELEIKKKPQ